MTSQDKDNKTRVEGFFGWLGRQVGHVSKAIQHPVEPGKPQQTTALSKTVYRRQRVEEQQLPGQPHVTLRRTTIDEAVVGLPRRDDKQREQGSDTPRQG